MILKPGKAPDSVASFRPNSLIPILGKVLESLFQNRRMLFIEQKTSFQTTSSVLEKNMAQQNKFIGL